MQDTPALAAAIRKRLAMISDSVTSYRLESGLVYRSDKLPSGDTHESIVAITPRDTLQLDNQNARQEFMSLMVVGPDVRPGRSKERLITASNETLILTSGSGSITDRESFHAALEQALLIAQVYLDAKASLQERGSAFHDSLVIKPRPQEDFDRRRSKQNFFTFFSDMFEQLEDNQLLRAIEAQEYPSTSFEEIKGQDALIESLQLFVSQLRNQKHFAQFGAQPPDGVLLSGPPGNGKSTSAAAIASALKTGFINISFKELLNQGGNIEKLLKGLIKIAEDWANHHPSGRTVLFLDEIDVHIERDPRFDVMLKTHLSGLEKSGKVIFIAATNRPEVLSQGLLDRFSLQQYVGNPSRDGIVEVLKFHFDKATNGLPCRLSPSLDLRPVAANLEGYSSRRLKDIVNLSLTLLAAEALQDDRKEFITAEHILRAAQQIPRGDGTPASSQKTGQKASFWRRLGFGR